MTTLPEPTAEPHKQAPSPETMPTAPQSKPPATAAITLDQIPAALRGRPRHHARR